jgi:SAM-dependent methyltransferase
MSDRHDAYRSMAAHYDVHGWDWYAGTYGSRLIAALRERGIAPPAAVVDAGCGTGTLALLLASEGYRVTGVDLSAAMIARAAKKDAAGSVAWRVGDLAALDLGATFDAAVSVADVFNHFETLDLWETALRGLHRHLRPGGVLAVDAMTCRGLAELDVQSTQERGGVTLILSIIYEPASRRSTLKVVSFVPAPGGGALFERAQETIVEWGQPAREILERFERAGFTSVERLWSDRDDPEDEHRLAVTARR